MTSTPKGMPSAKSEVATPAGLALPTHALVAAAAEGLIEQAKATGVALTGEGGLLTGRPGPAGGAGVRDHRSSRL